VGLTTTETRGQTIYLPTNNDHTEALDTFTKKALDTCSKEVTGASTYARSTATLVARIFHSLSIQNKRSSAFIS
jgi:hypothetical protein